MASPPSPRWVFAPPPDPEEVRVLERALKLPRALCALLAIRGFSDPETAKSFLRPRLSDLHTPGGLPDLPAAVRRIQTALEEGETLLVHGDYDVDGMAGVALLVRFLQRIGGRPVPFVPHRLRNGYDLGPAGLNAAEAAGASLLISVDCGIVAHEAVEQAGEMGIDVVVTDHHTPGDSLPSAHAVINPARSDSSYPNPHLCGAAVAFKLCQGLAEALGLETDELNPFLDLVGLATLADLVPLTGENRILARFGLRALNQTENPGLRALMREAGISMSEVSAGSVGFGLAPRLNALGRLGEPRDGLRLLLTDDDQEARALARRAEEINRERQSQDRRTLAEALRLLELGYSPEEDFGIVLDSDGWHPGVVGIVASRVVERVHRPVVLIAMDGDRGRGSARSIPQYHLLDGIRTCGEILERFGGHRMAAGLEIRGDRIPEFREAFNQEVRRALEGTELRPALSVEVEVTLDEMSQELHNFLQYVGPHGIGNPGPNFLARGVSIPQTPRLVGQDHLKLVLRQGGGELDAIGFHLGSRISPSSLGYGPVDVVFQLRQNEYRGRRRLQAHIKDIRPSPAPASERTDP